MGNIGRQYVYSLMFHSLSLSLSPLLTLQLGTRTQRTTTCPSCPPRPSSGSRLTVSGASSTSWRGSRTTTLWPSQESRPRYRPSKNSFGELMVSSVVNNLLTQGFHYTMYSGKFWYVGANLIQHGNFLSCMWNIYHVSLCILNVWHIRIMVYQ